MIEDWSLSRVMKESRLFTCFFFFNTESNVIKREMFDKKRNRNLLQPYFQLKAVQYFASEHNY